MQTGLDFLSALVLGLFHMESKHLKRPNVQTSKLIQTFILKVVNNERKILTHHEIVDDIAEQTLPVCKESKLWIHRNLRRSNFSFTYLSKFTCFCSVDIWTLKNKFC